MSNTSEAKTGKKPVHIAFTEGVDMLAGHIVSKAKKAAGRNVKSVLEKSMLTACLCTLTEVMVMSDFEEREQLEIITALKKTKAKLPKKVAEELLPESFFEAIAPQAASS